MPQFLIRVMLEDLNAEEQALLNKKATDFGLEPFVRAPHGQRFHLPPDTYRYEGNITGDDLRMAIGDAIEGIRNWQTVVLAETTEIHSHGLMPMDPPPES